MNEILVFGHKNPDTDSVTSAMVMANLENKMGNKAKAVILGKVNKETKYILDYLKIDDIEIIDKIEDGQEVILVDHNEFSHSCINIENAKILKVIDHHSININVAYQLYFRSEPLGCTACVLYKIYRENNIEIDRKIATLMLSAIISDTLLFKSPTCSKVDIQIAQELSFISKLDIEQFGIALLKAGTDLTDLTDKELITLDSKGFEVNGKKMIIAQINTANIPDVMKRKEKIEAEILNEINTNNIALFIFLITDIVNSNSQAIVLGKNTDIFEKSYNVKLENNTVLLPNVVSRKKQVLPVITKNA
ncbi:MAG: manganese-dependent inorganic pyrophosphatase [Clostridia bacterium]